MPTEPTDTTATDTTTDDQALVEAFRGDLDRNPTPVDDVTTELDRPEVGEK